jgi:hypothetical protein
MAGGRRLPPSIERLWLGELRRAHAIINIISIYTMRRSPALNTASLRFYRARRFPSATNLNLVRAPGERDIFRLEVFRVGQRRLV